MSRHRLRRPWWRRHLVLVTILTVATTGVVVSIRFEVFAAPMKVLPADGSVTVELDAPVNSFAGSPALGAGVDGLERGEIAKVWTPGNITAMTSAGFGSLSYRLRTELGVKAWHWNS